MESTSTYSLLVEETADVTAFRITTEWTVDVVTWNNKRCKFYVLHDCTTSELKTLLEQLQTANIECFSRDDISIFIRLGKYELSEPRNEWKYLPNLLKEMNFPEQDIVEATNNDQNFIHKLDIADALCFDEHHWMVNTDCFD